MNLPNNEWLDFRVHVLSAVPGLLMIANTETSSTGQVISLLNTSVTIGDTGFKLTGPRKGPLQWASNTVEPRWDWDL